MSDIIYLNNPQFVLTLSCFNVTISGASRDAPNQTSQSKQISVHGANKLQLFRKLFSAPRWRAGERGGLARRAGGSSLALSRTRSPALPTADWFRTTHLQDLQADPTTTTTTRYTSLYFMKKNHKNRNYHLNPVLSASVRILEDWI